MEELLCYILQKHSFLEAYLIHSTRQVQSNALTNLKEMGYNQSISTLYAGID
jgi:hypothetical protein